MAIDWYQLGADFQQKYEGTYCRYTSPLNKNKEVFLITLVEPSKVQAPVVSLYNEKYGELFLNYITEADLDFSFPEVGYFQNGKRALRFCRNYERQWKKGLCSATGRFIFPYDAIREVSYPQVSQALVEDAFKLFESKSLDGAKKFLDEKQAVSVAMSKTMALGVGVKEGDYWLWFEDEPIGEFRNGKVILKVPEFAQEIKDFLRDTGDYDRAIV